MDHCLCLLRPTLSSFSTWPRIIGVAASYGQTTELDNTSPSSICSAAAAAYISVQLHTNTQTTLQS